MRTNSDSLAAVGAEAGWSESPQKPPSHRPGQEDGSPAVRPAGNRHARQELRSQLHAIAPERSEFNRPFKDFLRDLHREKRRAERSGVPLSLLLYRVDPKSVRGLRQAEQLLDLLHRTKRITDIVGHLGNDLLAVLCPDTDNEGIKGFMKKVDALAGELPFSGVAATYPDDLFENLSNGSYSPQLVQPFLATDMADAREQAYWLKRPLDIAGALLGLVLLAPLMGVVAALVALGSKGPVIFKQTRVGQGGFPFTFYKFRSMATNADDSIHREFVAKLIKEGERKGDQAEGQTAAFKLQADPRITPIGRFIRKTSIDELPQLFNVLKGDMSLVGPRPPIPYEATQYQPWHLRRLMVLKPGLTGIWQVEGRSRVPFNEMVRMDLRYIRECSLMLDLKIILKTVVVVFRGDGAD